MDHATLTSSVEYKDDNTIAQLQFENPSEAIFASLFLKEGGIPWSFFDILLSAIHDPSFDARAVAFKDLSDFASRVAQIQERKLMRRRKAEATVAGLPEVILNGLIDALDDELKRNLDLAVEENHGFIPYAYFSNFPSTYYNWRITLINCALVHSTWLAPARRALGHFHRSSAKGLTRSATNPWIGSWTRGLLLPFSGERTPYASHLFFLRPIFQRLPNLQRLQLTMHTDQSLEVHTLWPRFFDSLCALPSLVELAFNVPGDPTRSIQMLSSTPLRNLKILHFLEIPLHNFDSLDLPHQISPLLTAFPSLDTIHFRVAAKLDPATELSGISWRKSTNELSSSLVPHDFSPFDVFTLVSDWPGPNTDTISRQWRYSLSTSRLQNLHCQCLYTDLSSHVSIANELQDIFSRCTALRVLSLRMNDVVSMDELGRIPRSVEDFNLVFPTSVNGMFEPSPSPIEKWDTNLANVLRAETSPHLRKFRAQFARRTVEEYTNDIFLDAYGKLYRGVSPADEAAFPATPTMERRPLLPRCEEVCVGRRIQFAVEVLLLL